MSRDDLQALFLTTLGAFAIGLEGCSCPPRVSSHGVHPFAPSGKDPAQLALDCERVCGADQVCSVGALPDGTPALTCSRNQEYECAAGRRPHGMSRASFTRRLARRPARGRAISGADQARVRAVLAAMAELETASIVAFEVLAGELARHGAPAALVVRARAGAKEEARHARSMGRLARARGGAVRPVRATRPTLRSLEEIAVENAREGCVLETFAALLAVHQAREATDVAFRATMAAIAPEEASHASLARDVDAWARTRLSAGARARIDEAHEQAWRELVSASRSPRLPALGIPSGDERVRLASLLRAALRGAVRGADTSTG